MAKNDPKQNDQATPRVYKANAVHKRRASRKIPAEDPVRVDEPLMVDGFEPNASESVVPETTGVSWRNAPDATEAPGIAEAPASDIFDEPDTPASEAVSETLANASEKPELNAFKQGFPEREPSEDKLEGSLPDGVSPVIDHDGLDGESDLEQFALPNDEQLSEPNDEKLADVSDSLDDAQSDFSEPPKRRKVRPRTVVLAVLAIIVVIAVAAASLFAWNRWGRYNDAEDFKGAWYVQGTAVPVTVDDSRIHLADSVSYSYAIDERDKTISYSFGDWTGQGRYRFSNDRSMLVITDGGDFTGAGNTADDFAKMLDELKPGGGSSEAGQAQEDGSIALSRTAPTVALVAQQVGDRITQEKAAAQQDLDEEVYDYYY